MMSYKSQETAYTLFACNLHKERDSMRIVAVAGNMETLYAVIGNEIIEGNMDYRGYSKLKGFDLFREDYKKDEFTSANLDYGYIEDQPILLLGSKGAETEWEQTYGWLTMDDSEYAQMRDDKALKDIEPNRLRILLNRAIYAITTDYRGAELYDYLRKTLGMQDNEITDAGLHLSEFYADPDEYEETDYSNEQEFDNDEEI